MRTISALRGNVFFCGQNRQKYANFAKNSTYQTIKMQSQHLFFFQKCITQEKIGEETITIYFFFEEI